MYRQMLDLQQLGCVCQAHRGNMGTHCLFQLSSRRTVCGCDGEKRHDFMSRSNRFRGAAALLGYNVFCRLYRHLYIHRHIDIGKS